LALIGALNTTPLTKRWCSSTVIAPNTILLVKDNTQRHFLVLYVLELKSTKSVVRTKMVLGSALLPLSVKPLANHDTQLCKLTLIDLKLKCSQTFTTRLALNASLSSLSVVSNINNCILCFLRKFGYVQLIKLVPFS